MKNIMILQFISIIFSSYMFAQKLDTMIVNVNNLSFGIDNSGRIGALEGCWNLACEGIFEESFIFHAGGFCLSGVYNKEVWSNAMFSSSLVEDYLPGKVGMNPEDERNKLYILKSSDPDFGYSWQEWKSAVELGAYFYDGDKNGIYNPIDINENGKWDASEDMPDLVGDLTIWCVFNDSKEDSLRFFENETPKGIEIRQTIFASASPSAGDLGNVVFIRYIIENIGTVSEEFDSTYFAFLMDHDIGCNKVGYYRDDLAGCDTTLEIGFGYNEGNSEDDSTECGNSPPAIILNPLQSPSIFVKDETYIDKNNNNHFDENIDTALDTGIVRRGILLGERKIIGAKNLNWNAFTTYNGGFILNDPKTPNNLRNYMIGGKDHFGNNIDVSTFSVGNGSTLGPETISIPPQYMFSGDPVTKTGWLLTENESADFRMLLSYGPFTFRQGEPIEVIAAYIVGRGDNHLSSITEAKRISALVDELYNNNFANIPVGIKDKPQTQLHTEYSLSQNYPNPFNPSTTIKYSIPSYQTSSILVKGRTEEEFVSLKVFDILGREITTLVNEVKQPGNYEVQFDANSAGGGLTSGMYFYELTSGNFRTVKKMILLK